VKTLRTSPSADLVPITDDLLERALDLYSYRPDKGWGLVDCASFALMQQRGIQEAFTVDRHFEQAGYTALLRDPSLS
jgi:predicted nucleic acid-binding protein